MNAAAVHCLKQGQQVVGVWVDGASAYLDGYPRAESDGQRAMNQKPDNLSYADWANFLSDRTPTDQLWWEAVDAADGQSAGDLLAELSS